MMPESSQNPPGGKPAQKPGMPAPAPEPDVESGERSDTGGEGYRVLLFNDEIHTAEEVVAQLVKALRCPMEDAFEIMSRAHHNGRAVVTIASRDEAERVAGVLREIGLGVQVDRV